MSATTWKVDKQHSDAGFAIRHMFTNVSGKFRDFSSVLTAEDEDFSTLKVEFTIEAESVDTDNPERDQHLRGHDFFDVQRFATIHFKSTHTVKTGHDTCQVDGNFTMHGVTRPLSLDVRFLGVLTAPHGRTAGFELSTILNRKDYGLVWNKVLDSGGTVLGDDVKITLQLEYIKEG